MTENKKRILRLVIAAVIAVCLVVSLFFGDKIEAALGWVETDENTVLDGGELKVHFIDVGQGDSCVIELPDERKMIIDGGERDAKDALLDYIDGNVFNGAEGIFDFAILTHPDSDHCGSLDDVINRYPAEVFYRPNVLASYSGFVDEGEDDLYGKFREKDTLVYKEAIDAAYTNCDKVIVTNAADDTQNLITPDGINKGEAGYYEINFYTPTSDSYEDWNDYSPIIILEYAGKRIALSGDAEATNEAEFVKLAKRKNGAFSVFDENFTVDVIKLGHHGSNTSSSSDYLETLTTPLACESLIAVISCGEGNSYGHPKPQVLRRLYDMGVKQENIYRTDLLGNIVVSVTVEDGKALLTANGNVVVAMTRSRKIIKWNDVFVTLMIADLLLLVFIPETVAVLRKGKKRHK